jgi:hypothetical protein
VPSSLVREKLRTTVVRGRGYDVAAHQQAAMPELLLAGQDAGPDRPEPADEPPSVVDVAALRALKASRTDAEALGLHRRAAAPCAGCLHEGRRRSPREDDEVRRPR